MKKVSQIELSELTQKDRKTIRYLLANMKPEQGPRGAKLYPSNLALETIYLGSEGAITNAEAVRQLNIAKKQEIELQMQITRGERIPIEDVAATEKMLFGFIRGTLLANHNKVLTQDVINEIFDEWRARAEELSAMADKLDSSNVDSGNGQFPAA